MTRFYESAILEASCSGYSSFLSQMVCLEISGGGYVKNLFYMKLYWVGRMRMNTICFIGFSSHMFMWMGEW